jgi:hypothetical protein
VSTFKCALRQQSGRAALWAARLNRASASLAVRMEVVPLAESNSGETSTRSKPAKPSRAAISHPSNDLKGLEPVGFGTVGAWRRPVGVVDVNADIEARLGGHNCPRLFGDPLDSLVLDGFHGKDGHAEVGSAAIPSSDHPTPPCGPLRRLSLVERLKQKYALSSAT